MRRSARGFTLIELLVVATIGAILVGTAMLSVNIGGGEKALADEAKRLATLMQLAADDAILQRRELGLRLTEAGYSFYRLDRSGEKPSWQPLEKDRRLRERPWPESLEIEMEIEGQPIVLDKPRVKKKAESDEDEDPIKPQVMFLSNGESLPHFAVTFRHPELDGGWRLATGEETLFNLERTAF